MRPETVRQDVDRPHDPAVSSARAVGSAHTATRHDMGHPSRPASNRHGDTA
ncbi:MAG: hypothetical protein QOF58_8346 [Pseudonocardiales bacterium]|jgi:hypothetical protein|nr:hypothetical protein [Pseudonocardiales bacterium]